MAHTAPSVPSIVSIFRTFDADKTDKLNAPEFLELVKTLMGARDGRVPSQKEANETAARIAHYMTITDVDGNVVRNVTSISLSDFIAAVNSGGSLARLISDALRVVPNLAEVYRAERGVPLSPPPAPSAATSGAQSSGIDDAPVVKLQRRAAAALEELRAVEAACEDLLDSTHHRHPAVRQLHAACQSSVSSFERCSSEKSQSSTPAHARTGISVTGEDVSPPPAGTAGGLQKTYSAVQAEVARRQNPYVPTTYAEEDSSRAGVGVSQTLDPSFSPVSSSPSPVFEIGKQVCCTYRRSDGTEGVRDVKVVAFVGSGTYAVEYEIDTVASHVSSPGDSEGGSSAPSPSQPGSVHVFPKGSKVLYRGGSTAEVLRVGDDETRDELGRPSYLLKVITYTDGANLSFPP